MFEVVSGGTDMAKMVTVKPRRCSCLAAVNPTVPQPMTATRLSPCSNANSVAKYPVPQPSEWPAPP